MKQPYSTCLVPTYAQLEQEVKALRAEAEFYKEELENLIEIMQRLREAAHEWQQDK